MSTESILMAFLREYESLIRTKFLGIRYQFRHYSGRKFASIRFDLAYPQFPVHQTDCVDFRNRIFVIVVRIEREARTEDETVSCFLPCFSQRVDERYGSMFRDCFADERIQ